MPTPGPNYRGWHYDIQNDRLDMYQNGTKAFHVDNCGNVAFCGSISSCGASLSGVVSVGALLVGACCEASLSALGTTLTICVSCTPTTGVLGTACISCTNVVTFTASC